MVLDKVTAASDGMGNLDKNGMTNNPPIEVRRSFPLILSPFLRFTEAAEAVVTIGGPFDIEMTPSKFIALFLAVNKSSFHPEISPRSDGWFFRKYSSSDSLLKQGILQTPVTKKIEVKLISIRGLSPEYAK